MEEADVSDEKDGTPSFAGGDGPKFELQRKMPDGSYRRAENSELAAADFQAKLKQAAEMTSHLTSKEKIEWALNQRKEGNTLFAAKEYKGAMDIYMTCLVAMEKDSNREKLVDMDVERDVQLPVLLNLALCATKLCMLRKAEKFCDFAIELQLGTKSAKAHFRRGRVRMLLGEYDGARCDLDQALRLLQQRTDICDEIDGPELPNDLDYIRERESILKEQQKLDKLVNRAETNRIRQKKAMELVLGGGRESSLRTASSVSNSSKKDSQISKVGEYEEVFSAVTNVEDEKGSVDYSLYSDLSGRRKFSTLRDTAPDTAKVPEQSDYNNTRQPTCFQWYLGVIGRSFRKVLLALGDDEEVKRIVEEVANSKKES